MADKLPSLNVLSGPLAGQRFVIEDAVDNILIGSDSSCGFVLDTPGVSPIHARLWVDLNGATVYDTNSPAGVYVNDDRVVKESPVRNGDILWLGPPGAEGSVLIQCILPSAAAVAAAAVSRDTPMEAVPERTARIQPLPEETDATMAFGMPAYLPDEPASPPAPAASEDEGDIDSTVVMSSSALMGDPGAEREPPVDYAPTDATLLLDGSEGLEVIDEPTMALPPPLAPPRPVAPLPPPEPPVEEIGGFPDFDVEPTVAMAPPPLPVRAPVTAPPVAPAAEFEDELEPTMIDTPAPVIARPPVAPVPPPVPDRDLSEDTDAAATVMFRAGEAPVIAPPPAPPPAAPPIAPAAPPPAAQIPAPARVAKPAAPPPVAAPPPPSRPAAEARPAPRSTPAAPAAKPAAPAPRARVERPAPPPAPVDADEPPAPARGGGSSKAPLIAGGAVVVAALLFAGYWFTRSSGTPVAEATPIPPPPVTQEVAPPTTQAAPPVAEEPPVTQAAAPPETVAPAPVAATTPAPTAVRTPPVPSPRVAAATPPPKPGGPKPGATPPPAGPTAAQQAAAAVSNLLGQAKTASDAKNYDAAVAMYDEVLKLDAQNAAATSGRTAALAARNASRRTFVTSRTVVQTEQKSKGNLSGFDSADVVQKNPDFLGRLEFAMNPPTVKPGEPYRLQIAIVNEGKKAMKVSGMTFTITVNGQKTGNPIAPKVKEVAPQQRVVLEELPGVFPADANSWTAEVLVTANKGDSLKNQITWK